MSTRAQVAIEMKDGSIQSIYNHSDGYIRGGLGEILAKHYQDREKVEKLISMGGASYITEEVGEEKNDFDKRDLDKSCFYHRDRDEDLVIDKYLSEDEWETHLKSNIMIEWCYLFTQEDKWKVYNPAGHSFDLETAINGGYDNE